MAFDGVKLDVYATHDTVMTIGRESGCPLRQFPWLKSCLTSHACHKGSGNKIPQKVRTLNQEYHYELFHGCDTNKSRYFASQACRCSAIVRPGIPTVTSQLPASCSTENLCTVTITNLALMYCLFIGARGASTARSFYAHRAYVKMCDAHSMLYTR